MPNQKTVTGSGHNSKTTFLNAIRNPKSWLETYPWEQIAKEALKVISDVALYETV